MRNNLFTLLQTYLGLCLFRTAPQDLPHSKSLLKVTVFLFIVCGMIIHLIKFPVEKALIATLLNLAVLMAVTKLLLWIKGFSDRFQQTFTAQTGAGIIIGLLAWPVFMIMHYAELNNADASLPLLFWAALFIWDLIITAHILRHALSTHLFQGFLLALIYPLVYFKLIPYLITP